MHFPLKSSHERRQLLTIPPLAQTQVLPIEDYGDVMVIPPAFDLTALTLHHLCSFRSDRSTMQLLSSANHHGDALSNDLFRIDRCKPRLVRLPWAERQLRSRREGTRSDRERDEQTRYPRCR